MQSGVNKQAFFEVQVTYPDGTPVNDAIVYLYNISTNPATFVGVLMLVPGNSGIYGVDSTTSYGYCLNVPAAGDVIVEALASRQGATANTTGVAMSDHVSACP